MNITVVGTGYVGLSNAMLLAQHNEVIAIDIDEEKIKLLDKKISPINDREIQDFLLNEKINFKATLNKEIAYKNANFVIVATPTNYDENKNYFDTSSIEKVLSDILVFNSSCTVIIKSTVPVGYTENLKKKYSFKNIIFSPEFLREGCALKDNLYPSRIVIGGNSEEAKEFASLLKKAAFKKEIPVVFSNNTEAEAVKLFSNSYLAMRVAFFNELDSFAMSNNLDTKTIVEAVSLDPRIGDYYNNPSFGYGGYCLPKDSKQLLSEYKDVPQEIISSIVRSNETRKKFIADQIKIKSPKIVGVYKLSMKKDSDNYRDSAILGIISYLLAAGVKVVIYEPSISANNFAGAEVSKDIENFKKSSDLILANRFDPLLSDVLSKVYSRDVFGSC